MEKMGHLLVYIFIILTCMSSGLTFKSYLQAQKRKFYNLINNDLAKETREGRQRHLSNFLDKMNLKKFDSDALEKPDDTIDAVKRTSHKHGFIYFFLDSDHDYKLSRQELSSFLDCSVFGDNKNATLTMLMSRDFNGDGLDVNEWEDIASLSRHGLAMELYRYKYG